MEEILHVYKVEMPDTAMKVLVVDPKAYILNLPRKGQPIIDIELIDLLETDPTMAQYEQGVLLCHWTRVEGVGREILVEEADVRLGERVVGRQGGIPYTPVGSVADKGKIPRTAYEELQAGVAQERSTRAQTGKTLYGAARTDQEVINRKYQRQIADLRQQIKDLEDQKAREIQERWLEAGQEVEQTLGRATSLDDLVARRVWK